MTKVPDLPGVIGRSLCPVCLAPVEVPFGARNYCKRCADVNRAFLVESQMRHPKFSEHARGCECGKCATDAAPVETASELHAHLMEAATWLR